jgi:hypothetical protein
MQQATFSLKTLQTTVISTVVLALAASIKTTTIKG